MEIYTDNGTSFVGAGRAPEEEIRNKSLGETFTNTNTRWMFNPPAAPHMGGVWERMVRSVKSALASMPQSRVPNDETLHAVLSEAQAIVNSRPLTFVSLDSADDEALTPNHFLLGSSSGVVQTPKTIEIDSAAINKLGQSSSTDQPLLEKVVKRIHTGDFKTNKMVFRNKTSGDRRSCYNNGFKRSATPTGCVKRPVAKIAVLDVEGCKTYLAKY